MTAPFKAVEGGVRLAVRLTPRAGREGLAGVLSDAEGRSLLAIRIAAPPVEGEANRGLIAFLAKALSLRKGDVEIVSGETSRVKIVHLSGDPLAIVAKLSALAEPS